MSRSKVLRPEFGAAVTGYAFCARSSGQNLDTRTSSRFSIPDRQVDKVYFTMPLLKGRTLRDHLEENGPLPIDKSSRSAATSLGALDYAHGKGVIHRDIKPSNTLLEDDRAYVADFGIARAVRVASGDELTDSGIDRYTGVHESRARDGFPA